MEIQTESVPQLAVRVPAEWTDAAIAAEAWRRVHQKLASIQCNLVPLPSFENIYHARDRVLPPQGAGGAPAG